MTGPSRLSQQIVAVVLEHVGVRSNAKERREAALNVDVLLAESADRYGDEQEYHLTAAMATQLEGERD